MIRDASIYDVDSLVELAHEMHSFSRYAVLEFAFEKTANMFKTAIQNPNQYILQVADLDDCGIIGGFIGIIAPHWACHDLVACDLGIFIKPDQRGKTHAFTLLANYIDWALSRGVHKSMITLGNSADINPEAAEKLYNRLGFKKIGGIYQYIGN